MMIRRLRGLAGAAYRKLAWLWQWFRIGLAKDKVAAKESYVTSHPDVEWWSGHLNGRLLKEAQAEGWLGAGSLGDFGCNHGACSIIAARLGWTVVGVDLNGKALAVGRKMAQAEAPEVAARISFHQARFNALPLADASLDAGYMCDVIEHIYPEDRRQAFTEIQRVLKPGARLLIVTPYEHAYDDGLQHVAFFDEGSLKAVLEAEGWKVLWVNRDRRVDDHAPDGHDRLNALVQKA